MGFFYGDNMGHAKKRESKRATAGSEKKNPGQTSIGNRKTPPEKPRKMSAKSLVKKAYEKVQEKLENEEQSSKAIDDLVKLMKLEKDLGGDEKGVKEIRVRWEQSEVESSKEE